MGARWKATISPLPSEPVEEAQKAGGGLTGSDVVGEPCVAASVPLGEFVRGR